MKRGISLVVLIITIVVIVILASSVIISLNRTNVLEMANKAKIVSYLNNFKDEFNLYIMDKKIENPEFNLTSLNASKEGIIYNTKLDFSDKSIKDIIKSIDDKFLGKIEIVKGELVINTKDINEINAAKETGIRANPYDVINGELQSSEDNLLLMDDTGTLTIPNSITSIGDGAFRDLEGLKTIIIPGNVKKIGAHAFSGNTTLENIILEEGIKEIGPYAFEDCINLKAIKMADSISNVGRTCFRGCKKLETFNLPKSLSYIPYRMFADCDSLKEVIIPENISTIYESAFEVCDNLEKIYISKNTNKISWNAFVNCYNLLNIEIDPENSEFFFKDGIVMSKNKEKLYYILPNLKELIIPDTVKVISTGSIFGNRYIKKYHIPKNVEKIESFFNSYVDEITVDSNNNFYSSINGNLYDKKQETLIRHCQNINLPELAPTLKTVNHSAFAGRDNINKIIFPESLEVLKGWCFSGSSVKEIYLGKNVKKLYTPVFSEVSPKVVISKENPLYKIVDDMYILSKDLKKLFAITKESKEYSIPATVEIIDEYCFYAKNLVRNIKLPVGVKKISNATFDLCINLEKVEIPSTIESIGIDAFNRCVKLKEIIIDKKENEISGSPWGAPYGLRAIKWKR